MKIKVYEGACGSYFITDKDVKDVEPTAIFDSVCEAEDAIESIEGWEYCDRDLIGESGRSYNNEDYKLHSFDFAKEFAN